MGGRERKRWILSNRSDKWLKIYRPSVTKTFTKWKGMKGFVMTRLTKSDKAQKETQSSKTDEL